VPTALLSSSESAKPLMNKIGIPGHRFPATSAVWAPLAKFVHIAPSLSRQEITGARWPERRFCKAMPGFIARPSADADVEQYEGHDAARCCASCGFAAAVRLRSQVAASSVRADRIAIIRSILCAGVACDKFRMMVPISTSQVDYGTDWYQGKRTGANER
jgi:hypothetical protein